MIMGDLECGIGDDFPQLAQFIDYLPSCCSQGHRSTLCIRTQEGGYICLLCLSNLITNSQALTVHVSYALSQLSVAVSQPQFLTSVLTFHPHFLISPLVHSLSLFDDDHIAEQIIRIVTSFCESANISVSDQFFMRVADHISSGALTWTRKQLNMLHCFGVLLNRHTHTTFPQIKDTASLLSNLVTGLQLPSEEIRGEILFILYKLTTLQCEDSDETDVLFCFCPKLLYLLLEALMKTQDDTVRLNCIAFLKTLVQKGFFKYVYPNHMCRMSSSEADGYMLVTDEVNGASLNVLFAEAIKSPLLSSDRQIQVSTVDLIVQYLSCEGVTTGLQIQHLVDESIVDYVFEVLRSSECEDHVVESCLFAIDILSTAKKGFFERLLVGFSTLIMVLHHVSEVPFHPVQHQTLKLVWSSISGCPGILSTVQVEELVLILTRMLKRHTDGEMGMIPETFVMICSLFVSLLESPSCIRTDKLAKFLQDATTHATLASLNVSEKDSGQILHAFSLLREVYSAVVSSRNCILDICTSSLLPWIATTISELNEEIVLGLFGTFHHILLENADVQTLKFAKLLAKSSWFSLLFGCLGLFSTKNMKYKVYMLVGSLVDVLLGNGIGKPIEDVASDLPADPIDLLFLLGQESTRNSLHSTCQSAVLLILHTCSLYNDWVADVKSVFASLEQYILVNSTFLADKIDALVLTQLVNLYGYYRGVAKMKYQIPYSTEAERILFHLITVNEWNLSSMQIHSGSLKWLFQQEKINKPLTYQILKYCQSNSVEEPRITVDEEDHQTFNAQVIAELASLDDSHMAMLLVCLLVKLVEEERHHDNIMSMLKLLITVIKISPAASNQFCRHGIDNAVRSLCCNPTHPSVFLVVTSLMLNILCFVHHEALCNDEAWLAVTVKLLDCLIPEMSMQNWSIEVLRIIAIFSFIFYRSKAKVLLEASKAIALNLMLSSAINNTIEAACSKGPTLFDYDEGTSIGEALIHILLLYYFYLRSLHVFLPGVIDWKILMEPSNGAQLPSIICINGGDLSRLIHFGSTSIKLIASYCLLELFMRLSEQRSRQQEELRCSTGYLMSSITILQGLVFHNDIRVSMNCSLCISILLTWREEDGLGEVMVTVMNSWFKFIVEESAISMAATCLTTTSTSSIRHHKPAVLVLVTLLRLQKSPEWIRTVLDEHCIAAIVNNLTPYSVTSEVVLFLRELSNLSLLKPEQIDCLNRVFQECRKCMYDETRGGKKDDEGRRGKFSILDVNGMQQVHDYLIHLMSSSMSVDVAFCAIHTENERLLEEIEFFYCAHARGGNQ